MILWIFYDIFIVSRKCYSILKMSFLFSRFTVAFLFFSPLGESKIHHSLDLFYDICNAIDNTIKNKCTTFH